MTFPFSTLPGLALHAGSAHRNPAALGFKRDGRWHGISSEIFLESVRRAGEALIALGLKPGDKVGIAAESSPFWLIADLAALGAGAVTVPVFPNASREALRHQIVDSGMRFLFVGDAALQEAFQPLCESVERVFVLAPRLTQVNTPGLPAGFTEGSPVAGEWEARAAAVQSDDVATLIYTSGSTGMPKGIELTHANIVSQVQSAALRFPLDSKRDTALSFLPLAHIFERMVSYFYLASGVGVHFVEDPKFVGEAMREVRPTLMTTVPRVLEKVHDRIRAQAAESGGLTGRLARAALGRAFEKSEASPSDWKDWLYGRLVYRRVRDRMGGRLRMVICGSAPLDARLCRFFLNVGVPVYEGYGLTESSPVLTVNYPGHRKPGTVGPAYPGVELRLAPDGEVLARGPGVMRGYHGQPGATRETVDAEGWLHTGDLGRLDTDGYLIISGRKKELFKTANGKYVAPIPIEQALAGHAWVDAALVVAEGRPFVTALIFPNFDTLIAFKRELGSDGSEGRGSFLRSAAVQERFREIVASVNEGLNGWEQIRGFHIASAPPSIEEGEMTPTHKLRRHVLEGRYAAKIEALYGG
jgi:long-chain acyl-CoA synthetase